MHIDQALQLFDSVQLDPSTDVIDYEIWKDAKKSVVNDDMALAIYEQTSIVDKMRLGAWPRMDCSIAVQVLALLLCENGPPQDFTINLGISHDMPVGSAYIGFIDEELHNQLTRTKTYCKGQWVFSYTDPRYIGMTRDGMHVATKEEWAAKTILTLSKDLDLLAQGKDGIQPCRANICKLLLRTKGNMALYRWSEGDLIVENIRSQ